MLSSMTGFGAGKATLGGEELSIELKSVNHKYCEVKVRLPRELVSLEPLVHKAIKDGIARGAVEVNVRRSQVALAGTVPTVDAALAKEYRRCAAELASALGLPDVLTVKDVMGFSGVMRMDERTVDLKEASGALERALADALQQLVQMRREEGRALLRDLSERLALIEGHAEQIGELSPRAVDVYRARLDERIAELTRNHSVDPQRLAQEVAHFAERTDVAEELTRLKSHCDQFRALMRQNEPSGRKMDFLVQEMNREVNTTGSKSQHPEISSRVVELKAELERIREQVQNVE